MTIDINCFLSSFIEPTEDCQLLGRPITLLVKPRRSYKVITRNFSKTCSISSSSQLLVSTYSVCFLIKIDRAMIRRIQCLFPWKLNPARKETAIMN